MKTQCESWEKPKIRKLTWTAVGASIAGMATVLGISLILRAVGWGGVSSGILIVPWMVVVIMMVQQAYHQGVCDERQREKEKDEHGVN